MRKNYYSFNLIKQAFRLIAIVILLSFNSNPGQTTVSIGLPDQPDIYPFTSTYLYQRSAALYQNSEIGYYSTITNIGWNIATARAVGIPVKIYLKQIAATQLVQDTWANMISGATLVYDNTVSFTPSGWFSIDINDFNYSEGNLLVLCESNNSGWATPPYFYGSTSANRHLIWVSDDAAPAGNGNFNSYRPNLRITYEDANVAYVSATAMQASEDDVYKNSLNNEIVALKVVTQGTLNPLSLTSVTFNTIGTTSTSDISAARVYYSNDNVFSTAAQFGNQIDNPNGEITFTGDKPLSSENFFWLVYDVKSSAGLDNTLDAQCTGFVVSDAAETKIPAETNPAGSRTVIMGYTGVRTIGSTGNYASIQAALNDFAANGVSDAVVLEILSDYNQAGETFPVVFNPVPNANQNNTITLRPAAGNTSFTISYLSANNTTLFRFDGADYFIIDGRAGGAGSSRDFTIENTMNKTTSCILIQGDASYNVFKYLNLKSNSQYQAAVVFGDDVAEGNNFNTIDNCDITKSNSSLTKGLCTSNSWQKGNLSHGNTITNNLFHDYVYAFIILSSGYNWSITNNVMFNSVNITDMIGTGIRVEGEHSRGIIVSNNLIGGNAPDNSGLFNKHLGNMAVISVVSNGTGDEESKIENNTIKNFSYTGGGTAFYGILGYGTGKITIKGNNISAIASLDGQSTGYFSMYGIRSVCEHTYIEENNIFDLTNNCTTTSSDNFIIGIYSTYAATIKNNNIYNMNYKGKKYYDPYSSGDSQANVGIYCYISADFAQGTDISGNTVYNLLSGNTEAVAGPVGIMASVYSSTDFLNKIESNKIYDLKSASDMENLSITGIITLNGNFRVANNFVSLGGTNGHDNIHLGIYKRGTGNCNYYFNSVKIEGNPEGVVANSAFRRSFSPASGNDELKNNQFICVRNGGGRNYALKLNNTEGLISDYNNLYGSEPATLFINDFNTTEYSFADWKTTTSLDEQSVSVAVEFVNSSEGNLHLSGGSIGNMNLIGSPIAGITTDIDGDLRNTESPYIGADENIENPLPVELSSFTASISKGKVTLNWQTATEVNNHGFEIERMLKGEVSQWEKIGFIEGSGNSNVPKSYSFTDNSSAFSTQLSYRLKQIDNDGKYSYSKEITVELSAIPTEFSLSQNYPNPFNPSTTIEFAIPKESDVTLKVYNLLGQEVSTLVNKQMKAGYHKVKFDATGLSSGIYLYKIQSGDFSAVKKLMLVK